MAEEGGNGKGNENWVEDLQRTVIESKDSAIRSARSFQQNSSSHFRSLQVPFPFPFPHLCQFLNLLSRITKCIFSSISISGYFHPDMIPLVSRLFKHSIPFSV